MKLSIVIPCYNESANIPTLLKRFSEVIGSRHIQVILVNNGSTDNTPEVLQMLLPQYLFAKSVYVPVNRGYGFGIIQGLREADGDYIGWTHADLQTDPKDVVRAYNIIKKYGDEKIYIKGRRNGRTFFDNFFTKGMSLFESIYFRTSLRDINAQPNVFPKQFLTYCDNPPYDFALEIYALYMAKKYGLKVVRFAVEFQDRIYGKSKWNTGVLAKLKFIKRTVKYSVDLKKTMRKGEKN